jgi:hypothetical protein
MNCVRSHNYGKDNNNELHFYCEMCDREMGYDEKRECLGACENDCHYQFPYGFVPEADCKIHDS